MEQQINTVMILGVKGTGNLGAILVSSLSKAGFKVAVLSRRSPSPALNNATIVHSDYTPDSLVRAFQGQDAVICAIPIAPLEDQKKFIDAAVAAKVKRFLPSEFGADTSVDGLGEIASVFHTKREIVTYLKQKQFASFSWTALCTGPWIDWMLLEGQGLLGLDVRTNKGTLFDSGDENFTTCTVGYVGRATAAVLLYPAETMNQYVQVNSFALTQNIILEALERVSGSKYYLDKMAVAELLAVGMKCLENNDWDGAYYKLATAYVYSGWETAYFPTKAEHWNKVLGLEEEETVDGMVGRVLANISSSSK